MGAISNVLKRGFEPFVGGAIKNAYPLLTMLAKDNGGPTALLKKVHNQGIIKGVALTTATCIAGVGTYIANNKTKTIKIKKFKTRKNKFRKLINL